MITEKVFAGKPYAGNPYVWFDGGGSRTGGNAEAWTALQVFGEARVHIVDVVYSVEFVR